MSREEPPAAAAVVRFSFDVVCPYAYVASTRVERELAGAEVRWEPVLLGGLYRNAKAPQGKDRSATAVMPPAKRAAVGRDLAVQADRHGVPLRFHPRHPVRTLKAMRLLAHCPAPRRAGLAAALYRAYWVRSEDVDKEEVLARYAAAAGLDLAAALADEAAKLRLRENTSFASDRGAFGVPCFFVERGGTGDRGLFWGQDRLPHVRAAAGLPARLPRVCPFPTPAAAQRPPRVRFYYDTSSPWSFLGHTQLAQLRAVARVEMVPVLVGAVFKGVGTPVVPFAGMTDAKRAWSVRDLAMWQRWWHEPMRWPDTFPLRTVLAQRCAIAEPAAVPAIMRAAWQRNLDIGDEPTLRRVLNEAGFDAAAVVARAREERTKLRLRENTAAAIERGVIGVPSYEVLDVGARGQDVLLFGQDRLDTVLDLCCGYVPSLLRPVPSTL